MPIKQFAQKLKDIFKKGLQDEEFFEQLEESLIESDFGARAATEAVDILRETVKTKNISDKADVLAEMKNILSGYLKTVEMYPEPGKLNIFMVLGVNGVGKTTTIAKLAEFYRNRCKANGVVLAAGDTFRAAAIEQLSLHAERLGCRIVKQSHGSDPGAVLYDGIESAKSKGEEVLIADTAGRMHNRANLIQELEKIDKIIEKKAPDAIYKKILVLDATTGQNALQQVEIFNKAVGIDGIVLAKFDSTAKGGIAVSVSRNYGIPMAFLGTGEKYDNIEPFVKDSYLSALLGG